MRIVCLSNMYPSPEAPDYGAFVRDMCDALAARGHDVDRVAITTRAAGAVRTPAKYAVLLARAVRAARGADVVYAHYLFPTGALAAASHRITGVPWVVTAHGGDVANLARGPVRRATARSLRSCSALIAVSEYLAGRLREQLDPLPPVHVVDMGVDLDRFVPAGREAARARLGLPGDGPLVLAVGGLTERKDPLNLLQAVARLRAVHPATRVAFVGDGPLAGAVRAGALRLGLPGDAVITPGALPHDEVPAWLAAADVLSMVSRVEPLGVAALEGLACGRPVMTTAIGGAREVVPDGGPGAVVAPGDPAALAAALAEKLAHPPDPAACRAVAEGHALTTQAGRVADILAAAAREDAAGSLPRR
ncbi:MAG: glycosyltransferase [Thermoleophilia bacterium]|nr:glycosyltransferase [Thermoleophilia bacterium]